MFFFPKALAKVRSNLKGKDRNNGKNSKLLLLIETRPLSPVTRVIGSNLSKTPIQSFNFAGINTFLPQIITVKNIPTYCNYLQPTETRNDLDSEYRQNSRQNLLSVDKFHYLYVPRIDMITPYDDFECILNVLIILSVFLWTLPLKEKKWCVLLSCNKLNDPHKLKESKSSHHYSFSNSSL